MELIHGIKDCKGHSFLRGLVIESQRTKVELLQEYLFNQ